MNLETFVGVALAAFSFGALCVLGGLSATRKLSRNGVLGSF